jgi:hypothetical protein
MSRSQVLDLVWSEPCARSPLEPGLGAHTLMAHVP